MIIDFRVRPPIEETRKGTLETPEDPFSGYFQVYKKSQKSTAYNKEEVAKIYDMGFEKFLEMLKELGIVKIVCCARDVETTYGLKLSNESISRLVEKYPEMVIGFAGVDPHKGRLAVKELENAVKILGLRGLQLEPYLHQMYVFDKKYYPIYEKCVELDIPIWIHTSMNWSHKLKIDLGRPIYLENVAIDFPQLKIVAGHNGWPWVNELCALAWKWPNIYIDTSSIRQKYFAVPGTGYEMLLHLGNTTIQDKILFGSGFPLLPIKQAIEDVRALPLKESVREKWFYKNAARLLGLDLGKKGDE